jgi:hypothetical protein
MADPNGFEQRLDSLVTEIRTSFADEVKAAGIVDPQAIVAWAHQHAATVSSVRYDRTPTGFCRTITLHAADLEKFSAVKL